MPQVMSLAQSAFPARRLQEAREKVSRRDQHLADLPLQGVLGQNEKENVRAVMSQSNALRCVSYTG